MSVAVTATLICSLTITGFLKYIICVLIILLTGFFSFKELDKLVGIGSIFKKR